VSYLLYVLGAFAWVALVNGAVTLLLWWKPELDR
jgi:hypothetical protein